MIEIQSGRVLIDGHDLALVDPQRIRLQLNVVSQDTFLMPGTLRVNLDPYERSSDSKLESTINKVGLWERVRANGGLDMIMKASDWSVGEKQLFALARAMAVQSRILILDEATSRYVTFRAVLLKLWSGCAHRY